MPHHREVKILPYTTDQLFDLVMDIEKYPDFLPWCLSTRVKGAPSEGAVLADVIVGFSMFREKFSCKVVHVRPEKITVEYQGGPMEYLHSHWHFVEMPAGYTEVRFFVDFEFKSKVLQGVASLFINEVVRQMTHSFEKRAAEIY